MITPHAVYSPEITVSASRQHGQPAQQAAGHALLRQQDGYQRLIESALPAHRPAINTTPHNYSIAETAEQAKALALKLGSLSDFCFDTETTSLDPLNTQLVAIAFCWEKGSGTLLWLPPETEARR